MQGPASIILWSDLWCPLSTTTGTLRRRNVDTVKPLTTKKQTISQHIIDTTQHNARPHVILWTSWLMPISLLQIAQSSVCTMTAPPTDYIQCYQSLGIHHFSDSNVITQAFTDRRHLATKLCSNVHTQNAWHLSYCRPWVLFFYRSYLNLSHKM